MDTRRFLIFLFLSFFYVCQGHEIENPKTTQWLCSPQKNVEKTLFTSPSLGFCYFTVQAPANYSIDSFDQQCQSISSNSAFLTICSRRENDFVASLATKWPILLSICKRGDSCVCKYQNMRSMDVSWDEPDMIKSIVSMKDDKTWEYFSGTSIKPKSIICKEPALSVEESIYTAKSETLDKCKQL